MKKIWQVIPGFAKPEELFLGDGESRKEIFIIINISLSGDCLKQLGKLTTTIEYIY